jgi:hypothetical protein
MAITGISFASLWLYESYAQNSPWYNAAGIMGANFCVTYNTTEQFFKLLAKRGNKHLPANIAQFIEPDQLPLSIIGIALFLSALSLATATLEDESKSMLYFAAFFRSL